MMKKTAHVSTSEIKKAMKNPEAWMAWLYEI